MTFVMDGKAFKAPLRPGPKREDLLLKRLGLSNQRLSRNDFSILVDDAVLNGEQLSFAVEPEWEVDGNPVETPLGEVAREENAAFDQFGIVSWHRNGHYVEICLDEIDCASASRRALASLPNVLKSSKFLSESLVGEGRLDSICAELIF